MGVLAAAVLGGGMLEAVVPAAVVTAAFPV
jgi:hypothetical protein